MSMLWAKSFTKQPQERIASSFPEIPTDLPEASRQGDSTNAEPAIVKKRAPEKPRANGYQNGRELERALNSIQAVFRKAAETKAAFCRFIYRGALVLIIVALAVVRSIPHWFRDSPKPVQPTPTPNATVTPAPNSGDRDGQNPERSGRWRRSGMANMNWESRLWI